MASEVGGVLLVERNIPEDNYHQKRAAIIDIVLTCCKSVFGERAEQYARAKALNESSWTPTSSGLEINQLSGGITNELFHVFDPENPSTAAVVVRVFGKETDRVISRENELFYQSQFLKTFVHGDNFLVYEFLWGYTALPYLDMPSEMLAIADSVAEFQVRATVAAKRDFRKPLYTTPKLEKYWKDGKSSFSRPPFDGADTNSSVNSVGSDRPPMSPRFAHCRFHREQNYLLHAFEAWVEQVKSEEIENKVIPTKRDSFVQEVERGCAEVSWMLEMLKRVEGQLTEGVCHNDMLCANIMRHGETRELKLIDFDYVKRNYLLYDLANHFNEYTGLDCDYEKYFPSNEEMARFIRSYRASMRKYILKWRNGTLSDDAAPLLLSPLRSCEADLDMSRTSRSVDARSNSSAPMTSVSVMSCGGNESQMYVFRDEDRLFFEAVDVNAFDNSITFIDESVEEATVQLWVQVVRVLTLSSHLSWGIWSLLQEAVSSLDIDFLEYAKLRLNRYFETKESFATYFSSM